ncbi:MAG: class I SAM-dependent methyltransferase, partial [Patescibacteria group bacterium]
MRATDAQTILGAVCKTYDTVAGEFSASRSKFWDELAFLVLCVKRGDNVLDIGCGNGRLFPLIKERRAKYTGIDCSEGLIHEAKQLHHDGEFVVSDALALPFQNNTFDIAYSFAVIHHIPGKELRAQFVREAARVLHRNGIIVLSAWDLWTFRHLGDIISTAVKSVFGRTPLDVGDLILTFGKNRKSRY